MVLGVLFFLLFTYQADKQSVILASIPVRLQLIATQAFELLEIQGTSLVAQQVLPFVPAIRLK